MASKRWSLEGKRALVTGGTRGIGFSISQELLALGGEVFIVARNAPQLENCIDSWREKGFGVSGYAANISSQAEREQIFKNIADCWGTLDILINNVGTNIRKPAIDYSNGEYQTLIDTNMNSTFNMCQQAYPLLRKSQAAAVVNILSMDSD